MTSIGALSRNSKIPLWRILKRLWAVRANLYYYPIPNEDWNVSAIFVEPNKIRAGASLVRLLCSAINDDPEIGESFLTEEKSIVDFEIAHLFFRNGFIPLIRSFDTVFYNPESGTILFKGRMVRIEDDGQKNVLEKYLAFAEGRADATVFDKSETSEGDGHAFHGLKLNDAIWIYKNAVQKHLKQFYGRKNPRPVDRERPPIIRLNSEQEKEVITVLSNPVAKN